MLLKTLFLTSRPVTTVDVTTKAAEEQVVLPNVMLPKRFIEL
jgi:hypothetical protein